MAKATSANGERPRATGRGRTKPRRTPRPRIRSVCAGRTLHELSAATGMNPETVRRQVGGICKPTLDLIVDLCLAYGISAAWLLIGLGPRESRR